MAPSNSIRQLLEADSIISALQAGRSLRAMAARSREPDRTAASLIRWLPVEDDLCRFLLIGALGHLSSPIGGQALADLLTDDHPGNREHAAWALAELAPVGAALGSLTALTAGGGFTGMLAQLAIEEWSPQRPATILDALRSELRRNRQPEARRRLVETASLVPLGDAQALLADILRDKEEAWEVRAAAAAGLTQSAIGSCRRDLQELCSSPDRDAVLAAAEALTGTTDARSRRILAALASGRAASDDALVREVAARALGRSTSMQPPADGLRVAQVMLQGRLDAANSGGGVGDSGGLATLMAGLGRALGRRPELARSLIIGRASSGPGIAPGLARLEEPLVGDGTLMRIGFGAAGDLDATQMWPHRVAIERGLERLLRRIDGLDAAHLRFADAGTLAAWRVFRRAGIPLFFSLAPDPHAVIRKAEQNNSLDRAGFAAADHREHYLFRSRLVETLAAEAHGLALFPRADQNRALSELIGLEPHREIEHGRARTVAEGVDPAIQRRAAARVAAAGGGGSAVPILVTLATRIGRLPAQRRGLPLVTAVGRLHSVKGFARLAEAWAGDPQLRDGFNLVLVGGDLQQPNRTEHGVLDQIDAVLDRFPDARHGLILLGHQANEKVACLLAATRLGFGPRIGARGLYVCPSDKEEFGLAILEAMNAQLPVVAPDGGGPATYLREGENGFLYRPASLTELRAAMLRAAGRRRDEMIARRARATVEEHYTVERMAKDLAGLYAARLDRRRLAAPA